MPGYQAFATRVVRVERLSPTFTRVTVTGESLAGFAGHGFDQRINLLFPAAGADYLAPLSGAGWYERWRATPIGHRPPLRTYTVRSFRAEARELDVDFVLHTDGGPGSCWAGAARPGDPVTVIGAVAGYPGPVTDIAWAPPSCATRLLLAADESALPAASAIAERLTSGERATLVVEVPEPADAIGIDAPSGVQVIWLARSRGERLASVLRDLFTGSDATVSAGAVSTSKQRVNGLDGGGADTGREPAGGEDDELWEVPGLDTGGRPGGFYGWLAGEAGTVVALRRYLVGERGVDRRAVAFMGYWRRGRPQPT